MDVALTWGEGAAVCEAESEGL
eukprot:COSAG05_NODE_2263_length_3315_cov_742.343177_1_plen_21_part_10